MSVQCWCDGVRCTSKSLTPVSSCWSHKDTRLDKPKRSQNTAVGVLKEQQRDLVKDHPTTNFEKSMHKKKTTCTLDATTAYRESSAKGGRTPDLFPAGVAQVDFSCSTVSRKASPTGWRHASYVLLGPIQLGPISTWANLCLGQFLLGPISTRAKFDLGQVRLRPRCFLTLVCVGVFVCLCVFVCVISCADVLPVVLLPWSSTPPWDLPSPRTPFP